MKLLPAAFITHKIILYDVIILLGIAKSTSFFSFIRRNQHVGENSWMIKITSISEIQSF